MKKSVAILAVLALVTTLFWLVAKPWIVNPSWSTVNWGTWGWPLIFLIVQAAVTGLSYALLPTKQWRIGGIAIIGLAYLIIFGFAKIYGFGLLALIAAHLAAMNNIEKEVQNRVNVDPRAIVTAGMSLIMLPLLIMLSFVYYNSPDVQASAQQNKLPASITKSVQQVTDTVAEYQFKDLSPSERNQEKRQLSIEVVNQLNALAKPYVKYFPPVLAFGLFLVLQGLSFLFIPLAGMIALGIFAALRYWNFVIIEEKDVKAQIIHL